ncbi:MAG: hypothetical protein AAF915_13325 [Cyanobacteria bacterium P01_D01_bin.50]
MFGKIAKKKLRRPRGKNLISSNRIKPDSWHISHAEVKVALRAAGFDVEEVKKVRLLKHQICISYWNHKGGVCSGFFSYRLFPTWQKEVEQLIENCPNFTEWQLLNYIMLREFKYYPYPVEMEDVLHNSLQNRLYVLKATERQTDSNDVPENYERYLGRLISNS